MDRNKNSFIEKLLIAGNKAGLCWIFICLTWFSPKDSFASKQTINERTYRKMVNDSFQYATQHVSITLDLWGYSTNENILGMVYDMAIIQIRERYHIPYTLREKIEIELGNDMRAIIKGEPAGKFKSVEKLYTTLQRARKGPLIAGTEMAGEIVAHPKLRTSEWYKKLRNWFRRLKGAPKVFGWAVWVGTSLYTINAIASCPDTIEKCTRREAEKTLIDETQSFIPLLLETSLRDDCNLGFMGKMLSDTAIQDLMSRNELLVFAIETTVRKGCADNRLQSLYNQHIHVTPNENYLIPLLIEQLKSNNNFTDDKKFKTIAWVAKDGSHPSWLVSDLTTVQWMNQNAQLQKVILEHCQYSSENVARAATCRWTTLYNKTFPSSSTERAE